MYDFYGQYNEQIIREMMQVPVPDIQIISELLWDITNPDLVQQVTDFLDKLF